CLNVSGASASAGAQIIQWPCQGGDNELWSFDDAFVGPAQPARVVSVASGMCADVSGESTADGASAIAWPCKVAPANNQSCALQRSGAGSQLVAQHSQKCLAVGAASTTDGAAVVQAPCQATTSQTWQTQPAASGGFQLVNANSGKCLDVAGGSGGVGV